MGFAVVENKKALDFGLFQSDSKTDPATRVGSIAGQLELVIQRHQPDLIALERVFAQANLRSVMGVAQISGALMAAAHKMAIPSRVLYPQ